MIVCIERLIYMAKDFSDDRPTFPTLPQRRRETVRILLISSQPGIESVIYTLYSFGFAEVHEWSDLQPEPHSGKLMSILTKSLWLD